MGVVANFATTAADGKTYIVEFYNMEMILSIGYRVKSQRGIYFRRWANAILKEFMFKRYPHNHRFNSIEEKLKKHEEILDNHQKKIDFFIHTSLPPVEGIFFDGQIYDAYAFVSELIRSASRRIVLIDNYIDDTVLTMLDKRNENVEAVVYTSKLTKETRLDILKHNAQYRSIEIHEFMRAHDRFMIIDEKVYLIGASIKDLGKKWFGFTLMECVCAEDILNRL